MYARSPHFTRSRKPPGRDEKFVPANFVSLGSSPRSTTQRQEGSVTVEVVGEEASVEPEPDPDPSRDQDSDEDSSAPLAIRLRKVKMGWKDGGRWSNSVISSVVRGEDDEADSDHICSECGNSSPPGSSPSFRWIQCSKCDLWYHVHCVGVQVGDYEGDREWLCSSCAPSRDLLCLSQIEDAPPQERLSMLGEKLYPLVRDKCPDLAGKIINWMLSNFSLIRLVGMQENDNLEEEIQEALTNISEERAEHLSVDAEDGEKVDKDRRGGNCMFCPEECECILVSPNSLQAASSSPQPPACLTPPSFSFSSSPSASQHMSPTSAAREAGSRFKRREVNNNNITTSTQLGADFSSAVDQMLSAQRNISSNKPPHPTSLSSQSNSPPPSHSQDHGYAQPHPIPTQSQHAPPTQPLQGTQEEAEQPLPLPDELPSLQEAHRTFIPTLTHVPKAARGDWSRTYTDLCNRVSRTPEAHSLWLLLSIFPRVILPASRGPRQADARSQAKAVRERLHRWRQGQFRDLWDEAVKMTKVPVRAKKKAQEEEKSQQEKNVLRATRLVQEGQYARSLQSLTSAGMAQHTKETLKVMRDKHPSAQPTPIFQPESNTPQMVFSQAQVFKGIKSFRRGSAPGPSGLRAEHLKVATKCAPPNRTDKATAAITKVVNAMAGGSLPDQAAPYMCGARLHAAQKKDGGVRPIAVGNMLRRLTSKCFTQADPDRAAAILAPLQLGVGLPGGCEAIAHSVRQVLEEEGDNPDLFFLQVDLINAYNMCSRSAAFEEVDKHFPDCISWVLTAYGCQAELVLGDNIILSSVGFHQGDPHASLLFSLVLQPIIERIKRECPDLRINAWYLDDGLLAGKKEDLQRAVDILLEDGPPRGLFLSTAATVAPTLQPKSSIWCPSNPMGPDDPLARGIPMVRENGITLLGTPIGDHSFVQDKLKQKIEKVRSITEHLPLLHDAHLEFVLLRSCLALPKVTFSLRTTDPTNHQDIWKDFDSITREALTRILGCPVNDLQWSQAKLPVSMGGLGLRAAEDHAPAAFISSLLSSQALKQDILHLEDQASTVSITPALLALLSSKQQEEATLESLEGASQKAISLNVDLRNQLLLIENFKREGNLRETARLASLGLPHSGDWLNTVPSPALCLHLRSVEFCVSVRYRLGCPVYTTAGKCPACPRHSDLLGDHAISCGWEGERIARHDHLRDALYHTAVCAALAPTKEGRFLLPGRDDRPADVLIPHWTGGKDTAWDVTVVNPLQGELVAQAARTAGHALSHAWNWKMTRGGVGAACQREGIVFLPLPVETLGGWHEVAVLQIRKLAAALARQTGQEESEATSHLFQKLSILLVKGNASLLLNRIPTFPDSHVDGVE